MLVTYEVSDRATLVVSVFGDLGEDQVPELTDQLLGFIDLGFHRTLVDVARCRFTDWSGVDVLLAAARRAGGREVGILAPTRELRRLLDAIGLSVALPVYASRDAARDLVLAVA
jgi:anti-anti-sigma factor